MDGQNPKQQQQEVFAQPARDPELLEVLRRLGTKPNTDLQPSFFHGRLTEDIVDWLSAYHRISEYSNWQEDKALPL